MRRITVSAALVLAFVSCVTVFAAELPYESYAPAVVALQRAGIIDVPTGNDVRVRDSVNRAEALKIILRSDAAAAARADLAKKNLPPLPLFGDMDQTAWYAPYVEAGFTSGLVKGYPDGTFRPGANVTVAEALVLVARLYGVNAASVAFQSSADLQNARGQWYTDAVSAVISRNAIMQNSRLNLSDAMTRGELFDLVYRMRTVRLQNLVAFPADGSALPSKQSPISAPVAETGDANQFASAKPFAISVPSIGIVDLAIIHPADPYTQKGVLAVLDKGVGHLMSYPGGSGKVLIYGHSSGWPWDLSQYTKIFRTINKVAVGAKVYVTYDGTLYVYQVTAKKTVSASDKTLFESDDDAETLILYTCWPPDSIQQRYLVLATPVEKIALK